MEKRNLLEETLKALKEHGRTPEDVAWVGSTSFGWFTWEEFTKVANQEYEAGWGSQKVASDLVVVGKWWQDRAWWLERWEYDGAEGWAYKELPRRPIQHRRPTRHDIFNRGEPLLKS